MKKKNKTELDIDAYLKAMNKKPSTLTVISSLLLSLWVFLLSVTAFAVLTKLMIEAWKWIL